MRLASIIINVGTKSNGNTGRRKIIVPGEGFKVDAIFKAFIEGIFDSQ